MPKAECKYKFQDPEKFNGKPYCTLHNELCEDISFACDKNCQIYEDQKILEEAEKLFKQIKNVLSISYDLWMYHIANGIGNSDNKNAVEALEDFSVAIRLLADTLGESDGYLSYSTNESKIYKLKKDELQRLNEVQDAN